MESRGVAAKLVEKAVLQGAHIVSGDAVFRVKRNGYFQLCSPFMRNLTTFMYQDTPTVSGTYPGPHRASYLLLAVATRQFGARELNSSMRRVLFLVWRSCSSRFTLSNALLQDLGLRWLELGLQG